MFDRAARLLVQKDAQLLDLNGQDLASTLPRFFVGPGDLGTFAAMFELRDATTDAELVHLERGLTAWSDQVLSGYLTFAGYGDGSTGVWGQQFAAEVVHSTDPLVGDLQAYGYPDASPPNVFSTEEGSDTAQDVQRLNSAEVTVKVAQGAYS